MKQIESISEKEIDCSDIPETDDTFWAEAELRLPQTKKGVYLRLDPDLIDWLKRQVAVRGTVYLIPVPAGEIEENMNT